MKNLSLSFGLLVFCVCPSYDGIDLVIGEWQ